MRTNSVNRSLLLGILLTMVGGSLQAQFAEDALRFSLVNVPVGSRTLSMGGAGIGIADDFSALFTNPAGLAQLRSYEFSVGLLRNGFANDVTYLGATQKSDNGAISLNNLGIVYPVPTTRGSMTFAFGFGRVAVYNSTASFDAFNPDEASIITSSDMAPLAFTRLSGMLSDEKRSFLDNNIPYQLYLADTDSLQTRLYPLVTDSVQQSGKILEGGGLNHWSFGGAVEIARNVSLGVSLNFVSGTYSYDREFTEQDSRNIYTSSTMVDFDKFTYINTIKTDISGFNALIGLMYRKPGVYRLGLTVRTPATLEMNETFTDEARSVFDNRDSYKIDFPGQTKYKIVTPWVMSGGFSYQFFDWLVIGADAEYTDWSTIEFDTDNAALIAENRRIKNVLRATTNVKAGAEVTLWDAGVKLRAGAGYYPSQFKGDPTDFDQIHYSAGIGFEMEENTMLNIGYSLGSWKTYRDNYYTTTFTSRTSEKVSSGTINLTLAYRF